MQSIFVTNKGIKGGAIYFDSNGKLYANETTFANNTVTGSGGALYQVLGAFDFHMVSAWGCGGARWRCRGSGGHIDCQYQTWKPQALRVEFSLCSPYTFGRKGGGPSSSPYTLLDL